VGAQPSARGHPRPRWLAISGVPSLGSAAQLVLLRPAATEPPPPKGRAVSRARPERALSSRLELVGPACRRPVSLLADRARHPEPHRESQSSFPRTPTKGHGCSSSRRLPPASPTASTRARARAPATWAATGTLAWPPAVQLPTCVHAPTRGALGRVADRLFAGAPRPHAACQLLQWIFTRAHQRPSDLRRSPWQATSRQMTPPLAGRHPPGFLRSGIGQCLHRPTPATTTARRNGFTPA